MSAQNIQGRTTEGGIGLISELYFTGGLSAAATRDENKSHEREQNSAKGLELCVNQSFRHAETAFGIFVKGREGIDHRVVSPCAAVPCRHLGAH